VAAAQPYTGLEQYYSIACNEAPSPPASAFADLQHLVLRRGGLPPKGTVCPQDLPPFAPPAGWRNRRCMGEEVTLRSEIQPGAGLGSVPGLTSMYGAMHRGREPRR
jgi:hypothetical protein